LADAEAKNWYQAGLDALGTDEEDAGLAIDLRCGLGEAQRRISDPSFRATLIDAAQRAADHGDVDRLVRAVLANNRGFTSVIGKVDEERITWIETALDRIGPEPTSRRADLLSLLAAELAFGPDHRSRLKAADEATAIAAVGDDPFVKARVATRRLISCLVPDRITALADECADIIDQSDATGDPLLRVLTRTKSVGALSHLGRLDEVRRMTTDAVAITDETGHPNLQAYAQFFHAGAMDAQGDHADAARLTQSALELGQLAGMPDALMWYAGRMWVHWTFEGQGDAASAMAVQGYAEYPLMSNWPTARAVTLRLADRDDELAALMAEIPGILSHAVFGMFWLVSYFFNRNGGRFQLQVGG
jgi:hypothetical protein